MRPASVNMAIEIAKLAITSSGKVEPCTESADSVADFIEKLAKRIDKVYSQI